MMGCNAGILGSYLVIKIGLFSFIFFLTFSNATFLGFFFSFLYASIYQTFWIFSLCLSAPVFSQLWFDALCNRHGTIVAAICAGVNVLIVSLSRYGGI